MDADFQRFILFALQAIGGAFCTVIWFNYRDIKAKSDAAVADLAQYKTHIAETYITQSEFTKMADAIFKKLDRIEDKLDGKQDKT